MELIAIEVICPICSELITEMYAGSAEVQCPRCGEMVVVDSEDELEDE